MKKIPEYLAFSVGILMIIIAIAKIGMVIFYSKEFFDHNLLFESVPNWLILTASGVVEIFVALQILRNRFINPIISGLWILWFCVLVTFYRLGMLVLSPHSSCHCFGLIGMLIGSGNINENILAIMLLLIFSLCGLLIIQMAIFSGAHKAISGFVLMLLFFLQTNINAQTIGQDTNQAVKISGYVIGYRPDPEGNITMSHYREYGFSVYLYSNQWVIIADIPIATRKITSCDGKFIYQFFSLLDKYYMMRLNKYLKDTNELEQIKKHYEELGRPLIGSAETSGSGLIYPHNIPCEDVYDYILWLFLILRKDIKNDLAFEDLPLASQSCREAIAWHYKPDILWSDYEPKLIKNVKFYYDKTRILNSLNAPFLSYRKNQISTNSDYVKMLIKAIDNYTNRFIIQECNVISWTNTSFGVFPKEFEYMLYEDLIKRVYEVDRKSGPKLRVSKDILPDKVIYRSYGVVTNITGEVFPGAPYPFSGYAYIADYRYRDLKKGIDHIVYYRINFWPTNKIENHPTYRVIKVKYTPATSQVYRYVIILFVLCTILIGVYLWWTGKNIMKTNIIMEDKL